MPQEWSGQASLYVTELVTHEERTAFEKGLKERDPEVMEAFAGASATAACLGLGELPVSPPPGLRARLMERIAKERAPGLGALLAHEGQWRETGVLGVTYKRLFFDRAANLVTNLVRMAPGAVYPAHVHSQTEQCLILEGDLVHDGHSYGPGDFTWAEGGTLDPELRTRTGNLLLIISAPENKTVAV